jgi:hypothetical protein
VSQDLERGSLRQGITQQSPGAPGKEKEEKEKNS